MTTPIASSGRPTPADGIVATTASAAEDQARLERMVDAVRRLGEQLQATHRTLDAFVARLSVAAGDARAAAGTPVIPAPAATPSHAVRPAVGTPVRRPEPAPSVLAGARPVPPVGLAEHVRGPGGPVDGPTSG